jgi:fucose permease
MFKTLDRATRRLYFLLLAGFVLFGVIFTVAGAALPQIIRSFGWSYTVSGLVLAASSAGYFLASFVNGFLVQRYPPRIIMLIGLVIGALCMSLFVRWPSPWLNLLLNLGIGVCQGSLEVVTNLEVIHMEKKGQSRLMNLIHASFCAGAIIGPSAVGYILKEGIPLVSIFIIAAVLFGILAVIVAFARFPRVQPPPDEGTRGGLRLLREPLLLIMTAALLVYVGTEIGVSSWSSEYVVKVLGVSASTGAFAVAVFWLGLLAGRLAISFGYKGSRQELIMLALSVLSAAALVGVLLARSTAAVAAAVFIAGLGSSGFYPLGMSVVGRHFKSGVAVGTVATGGAAGSIAFPFAMALISQTIGIRRGFWFYLGMNVFLVVLAGLLVRSVRKSRISSRG